MAEKELLDDCRVHLPVAQRVFPTRPVSTTDDNSCPWCAAQLPPMDGDHVAANLWSLSVNERKVTYTQQCASCEHNVTTTAYLDLKYISQPA